VSCPNLLCSQKKLTMFFHLGGNKLLPSIAFSRYWIHVLFTSCRETTKSTRSYWIDCHHSSWPILLRLPSKSRGWWNASPLWAWVLESCMPRSHCLLHFAACSPYTLASERMPATAWEIVVLRNLILQLVQGKSKRSDILKYFNSSALRMEAAARCREWEILWVLEAMEKEIEAKWF